MPSRRAVLAFGGTAALTGCLGTLPDDPAGRTDEPRTDETTGHEAGPTDGTECQSGTVVRAREFAPDALTAAVHDAVEPLLREATDDPVEVTAYGGDPFRDGVYVRFDGTYYRTSVTGTDAESVPARLLALDWERGREAPADAGVLAYDDLPESDREALRLAVHGPEYERDEGLPTEGTSVSEFPAPYPDGAEDSELVGAGETWVRWDGRDYRVELGAETTATRRSYRVALEAVGADEGAFREHVAAEFLLELDPSEAERELLAEAADGKYEECEPASDALGALRSRLDGDAELPHPADRSWYVAVDGDRRVVEVTGWVV
ncbi:hypothetical protein [Halorarum salinum]|uniref:Uncharacterized protein n=1 Tax=Halorarum salinum TaxID=2743089 RepID=A0A7D5L8P3_9EURY|nr:hypothetical protein [Halobaculum salinum]QLG60966.1 hypothetical protein HUG12_04140 [Halobaculum salinum]